MTSTEASPSTSVQMPEAGTVDMNLEVVTLPVSDVDRAKGFYQSIGWRLDADIAVGDAFRAVQFTAPHSPCSVAFGKGLTTGEPGSVQRLLLAVYDIDAARDDLLGRGIEVSGVFHLAGGRVPGPDPQGRSIRPTPRSATRTATDGYCRKSRRGSRAGSGPTQRRTSQPWPACYTRRPRITTLTRSAMLRTTGGTGTPPTSTRASRAGHRTKHRRPRTATCRTSSTWPPGNGNRTKSMGEQLWDIRN